MPAETHTHQAPLDRSAVERLVADRVGEILHRDPAAIGEGDELVADLGLDSALLFELFDAIEEEVGERTVGFAIDDEDLEDLATVGDVVDYVAARVS